jgi:hypothetical protein
MIKVTNISVMNFENAIRGMRNPLNSWAKSDSDWEFVEDSSIINPNDEVRFVMGENDLALAMRLANAGSDDRKFLRQIFVSMDITAPFYWWKEFDTYKVGTVANSCSTMHRIHSKEFTLEDFSWEHLTEPGIQLLEATIDFLNHNRKLFNETKDKLYWHQMIQMLPTSYEQLRTVTLNYEVLRNMYHARKHHKLDEWREFCKRIESLPYSCLITGEVTTDEG